METRELGPVLWKYVLWCIDIPNRPLLSKEKVYHTFGIYIYPLMVWDPLKGVYRLG